MMNKKIVENILNIYGSENDIESICARVRSLNKNFDLDNIVDVPTDLEEPVETRIWKSNHWGTPENAFDVHVFEQDTNSARFEFCTEHDAPYIAIAELSAIYPDCDMTIISSSKDNDKYSDIKINFYDGKVESVSRLEWIEDIDLQEKYNIAIDGSRGD